MELPASSFAALERVVRALEAEGHPTMLVGALATFAWGEPRTTRDFDVAVRLTSGDQAAARRVLASTGVEPQGPFETDWGPRFILPFKSGMPVDVFLAGPGDAPAFERRRRVVVNGVALWVQSPEDLVLTKLRNAARYPEDRTQDLADAVGVVFKQWLAFDVPGVQARCGELRVCDHLRALLDEVRAARRSAGLPV